MIQTEAAGALRDLGVGATFYLSELLFIFEQDGNHALSGQNSAALFSVCYSFFLTFWVWIGSFPSNKSNVRSEKKKK